MKWSEMLSVASSIATLTGVSLVWLSTQQALQNVSILKMMFQGVVGLIASLVTIGLFFLLVSGFVAVLNDCKQKDVVYVWTFGLALWIAGGAAVIWFVWGVAVFLWSIN
ncbi:hypothetical protein HX786_00665 [Pseudomonas sp. 21615526]|uniref:hypothetical protein n=1 Tax=Pseudomonas sp. 21615526 TaxID=2738811 RepID=UPI0015BF36F0|nr:hypothetical protein [Pseudomonas sp. 21615526]NVZ36567.1 hypothetical protein [Pseudomonas sp. 21615526]